ncbi:MAG: YdeI/OmpD-associated family protein [Ignavibacteriales bacterium]|nr:YdeI/OmpD-associated family protein [Ignavibacteriales bacterium]MCF8306588.1 YdeI/OmpD-associated family protein [Ignavibacteriales bacterium]MCF8316387.1 YdeI/OmpD-associated family protein [Ignavibacteriales bacterium]MCF8437655.1 YdeI/OmpD-associated family protein [Ignavibacteriales bacterium]
MSNYDTRIDTYISKSEDFAKPILNKLRLLVHTYCPDVNETIKWSFPVFEFKGVLCNMAAFKSHCGFGFWKASLMESLKKIDAMQVKGGFGNFGQIRSLDDLPADEEIGKCIQEAMLLNDSDIKPQKKSKRIDPNSIITPDDLSMLINSNPDAKVTYESFSPSHKREYIEWIEEAKTDLTRRRRIDQTIQWLSEGKGRNWKYEKKV